MVKNINRTMQNLGVYWIVGLMILSCSAVVVQSQIAICTCQPSRYMITLDLSFDCDSKTINAGDTGILDSACAIQSLSSDKVPIGVSVIEISELNQNLNVTNKVVYNDTFVSGDSFRFSSILATSRNDLFTNDTVRPRGLQMYVHGFNAASESVVNTWVILFNNNCDEVPVIPEGKQIGWATFTSVVEPPARLCPLFNTTTVTTPSDEPTVVGGGTESPVAVVAVTTKSPTQIVPDATMPVTKPVAVPVAKPVAVVPVTMPVARPTPTASKPIVVHNPTTSPTMIFAHHEDDDSADEENDTLPTTTTSAVRGGGGPKKEKKSKEPKGPKTEKKMKEVDSPEKEKMTEPKVDKKGEEKEEDSAKTVQPTVVVLKGSSSSSSSSSGSKVGKGKKEPKEKRRNFLL